MSNKPRVKNTPIPVPDQPKEDPMLKEVADLVVTKPNRIAVYGGGGTAINLLGMLPPEFKKESPNQGVAFLDIIQIDTSTANLEKASPDTQVYLVDKDENGRPINGGGQERALNYKAILAAKPEILNRHIPSDVLNIVIASGGGGTGGPTLNVFVQELLAQQKPVIAVVVGCVDTYRVLENTIKTLASLQMYSRRNNVPAVVFYVENDRPQSEVDKTVLDALLYFSILASGQNHTLDTRDLHNVMYYTNVTPHPADMVMLRLTTGNGDHTESAQPTRNIRSQQVNESMIFSAASLYVKPDDKKPLLTNGTNVAYEAYGYLPNTLPEDVIAAAPIRFAVTDGPLATRLTELEEEHTRQENAMTARTSRPASSRFAEDASGDILL